MKNNLSGHTVKVRHSKKYPDPYAGERGKVVCVVRRARWKEYIVQFENDWSGFGAKQLRLDE